MTWLLVEVTLWWLHERLLSLIGWLLRLDARLSIAWYRAASRRLERRVD